MGPDEQTVYGLVDQPKFFNVVKHQLFYFPALLDKVPDGTWSQKIAVFFMGPGWFPGLPRMGDNNLCPEIPQREKHFTSPSRWRPALFFTTICLASTPQCHREPYW